MKRRTTLPRLLPWAVLATAWLGTRALMLWLLHHGHFPVVGGSVSDEVGHLYHRRWYHLLSRGEFPQGDPLWQYPPGAGVALLLPRLIPGLTYVRGFKLLLLAADALITVALAVGGTRDGRGPVPHTFRTVPHTSGTGPRMSGPGLRASRADLRASRTALRAIARSGLRGTSRTGVPGTSRTILRGPSRPLLTGAPGPTDGHGPSGAGLWGAAFWTASLPLLLTLPLSRFDLLVTAPAVLSLLLLRSRPRTAGALAVLGALVKLWPGLILLNVPFGQARRAWWSAAVTAATTLALIAALFDGAFGFLRQQRGRGVQIESLGGTALSLATHAGWSGQVQYRYGSMEFVGPYVQGVAWASLALSAAAFALLLLWRVRTPSHRWPDATPYDATLAAVLLFTVTSRVISPQYMMWLLGLSAVCLTARHTTQRPVAALLMAAAAVSSMAYPVLYDQVMACTWKGCAVMLLRNTLLACATVLSMVRLWRSTRTAPREGRQQRLSDSRFGEYVPQEDRYQQDVLRESPLPETRHHPWGTPDGDVTGPV